MPELVEVLTGIKLALEGIWVMVAGLVIMFAFTNFKPKLIENYEWRKFIQILERIAKNTEKKL